MKTVTFSEYKNAKYQIIGGVEYKEHSELKRNGRISKQYATENNGTFYEVTENGITEFWSDKHPDSRYYDGRNREEIIAQYEEVIASLEKENKRLSIGYKITEGELYTANQKISGLMEKLVAIKVITDAT